MRYAVPRGGDCEQKTRSVGISATTINVLTEETSGGARCDGERHFYVLEGENIVDAGPERFRLKAGDCVPGPA